MFPSNDLFNDAVGVGGPDEGFGAFIVGLDVAVDGFAEFGDGAEDAALEPVVGELGEEGLHRVEPGASGRGEVHVEAGMALELGPDLGMLVGGVVVHDEMDVAVLGRAAVDGIKHANEFLMTVAGRRPPTSRSRRRRAPWPYLQLSVAFMENQVPNLSRWPQVNTCLISGSNKPSTASNELQGGPTLPQLSA